MCLKERREFYPEDGSLPGPSPLRPQYESNFLSMALEKDLLEELAKMAGFASDVNDVRIVLTSYVIFFAQCCHQ